MTTRTSKKQMHEAEKVLRDSFPNDMVWAAGEYNATGRAYVRHEGEIIEFANNTEALEWVLDAVTRNDNKEEKKMTNEKQTRDEINDMIFKTLKTKGDKPAKYAEQLRELGYEVTNVSRYGDWESDYWRVNGVEFFKPDKGAISINLRGRYYERLDNILNIDFVGYFEKRDERNEKAALMQSHDGIEQRHEYWVETNTYYIDENGEKHNWGRWTWTKKTERRRHHRTIDNNWTIMQYKRLKRESEGNRWTGLKSDADYAREDIERAEKAVGEALEES